MRRLRHNWLRYVSLLALVVCGLSAKANAVAVEVTKDDVDFRKSIYLDKKGTRLPYRLYVPREYSKEHTYPLVFWLHGGTGRGSDNLKQLTRQNERGTHFWISDDAQSKFPAFVLVPQCPSDQVWADPEFNQPSRALELSLEILAKVQKDYAIDPDRIYLAGQSMGGLGVWSLLQKYPEKWAGAIVMSAFDNFSDPQAIARIPLWVFQGDQDMSVPVNLVRGMMKQLEKLHANVRYTEYRNTDHEVWNKAFAEPDLLPWLSVQKRGEPTQGQVGSGAAAPTR